MLPGALSLRVVLRDLACAPTPPPEAFQGQGAGGILQKSWDSAHGETSHPGQATACQAEKHHFWPQGRRGSSGDTPQGQSAYG